MKNFSISAKDMTLIVVASAMPDGPRRDSLVSGLSSESARKVWLMWDKNADHCFRSRRRAEHADRGLCDFGTDSADGRCHEKATWQVSIWPLCARHAKICSGHQNLSKSKDCKRIRK